MTRSNQVQVGDHAITHSGLASPGQRLLWAFERSRSQSGALNVPVLVRLRGNLNRRAMENAVAAIVARHEALRTRIQWKPPHLTRLVAPEWRPNFRTSDVSQANDPATAFELELKAELTIEIAAADWPLRPTIWTLNSTDHVICLNLNHMATDSVSNMIILNELAVLYKAECGEETLPLPPIGWQYSQWVDCQMSYLEGRKRTRLIEYWETQLAGALGPRFSLTSRPVNDNRITGYESECLAAGVFDQMSQLAKELRATPFCVVLAILYAVICRQTTQTDLTIMTLLSDRIRPQVFSTVGYFINLVPLRTPFHLTDSFAELVCSCRSTLFGAIQHQAMPFHLLPRSISRQADIRIDDVVVQMMGDPAEYPKPFEPWNWEPDFGGGRTFELEIVIQPVLGSWHVNILYGTHRFEREFIRALLRDFCHIASAAIANPQQSLNELVNRPHDSVVP